MKLDGWDYQIYYEKANGKPSVERHIKKIDKRTLEMHVDYTQGHFIVVQSQISFPDHYIYQREEIMELEGLEGYLNLESAIMENIIDNLLY